MSTFVIFFNMSKFRYIFFLYFILCVTFVQAQKPAALPKYEYRAVWVTTIENLDWPRTQIKKPSDIAVQQRELIVLLDSLKTLNVNCVMLQTRVRGDVLYPSKIEPFSKVLTGVSGRDPGYDPLAFAIEECHKRGMQLHAWVVTLPLGDIKHVASHRGKALNKLFPQLCRVYNGNWYMEAGEPATADYLARLAEEMVSNYELDGIHLDYIRYPDKPSKYPDGYLFRKYGAGLSRADWRRANITRIMREVYNKVKNVKPWVRVSCAPLGKNDDLTAYSSRGYNAVRTVYQEPQRWLREGIVDAIFPMIYFSGNDFYPFMRDWEENSCGRHIVPGIGAYRLLPEYGDWEPLEVGRQLVTSRSSGTDGTIMFRLRHLLDNIKGFYYIYRSIYATPSLVPPMTWCGKEAPDAPKNFSGVRVGDTLHLKWDRVEPVDGMPALYYNLYASDKPVDITSPRNFMGVMLHDNRYSWVGSKLATMYWALTAVDAYGIESEVVRWEEPGHEQQLFREEFLLPKPAVWGMRIVLKDAVGAVLYNGKYRTRVGVRGLPPGCYMLEILSRDGVVLDRLPFVR